MLQRSIDFTFVLETNGGHTNADSAVVYEAAKHSTLSFTSIVGFYYSRVYPNFIPNNDKTQECNEVALIAYLRNSIYMVSHG
jgi:hypothetical protein